MGGGKTLIGNRLKIKQKIENDVMEFDITKDKARRFYEI
jgi:hypothetical protein